MIAIAPVPGAVEIAAIVSSFTMIEESTTIAKKSLENLLNSENHDGNLAYDFGL